jgi:glycosyltransferase involved in cell wall biosynthesis
MRILQICHGYPPRENAGTERHTQQLVDAMTSRGVHVHVLSATRAPGRPQYSRLEEPGITRLVNNISARPLAQGERDRAIEQAVAQAVEQFQPDIVHLQHVQFLSSGLRFPCPSVITLHDQWGWCASGGLGIQKGQPCAGPTPELCAPCHADWRPVPGRVEQGLSQIAGLAAPWIAPEILHRAYRRLPHALRVRATQGSTPLERPEDARYRNQQLSELLTRCDARVAPSQWLADRAEAQGLGPVRVIRHGVDGGIHRRGGGPFLFLGTIAPHKGPDLVVEAWRASIGEEGPDLRLHGPCADPRASAGHPIHPPLTRAEVWEGLSDASALIMGSRWPENAPLVLVEARAAGCPVIAPRIGGIPELVEHGRDGLLYTPGNISELGQAMKDVMSREWNNIRPPRRHQVQVDDILSLYDEVLST